MNNNPWSDYTSGITLPEGLYWWRVAAPAVYGGRTCWPEWTAPIIKKRDGCANKDRLTPEFSYWTGWQYVMQYPVQWRRCTIAQHNQINIPGIHTLPCPFCGGESKLLAKDVCDGGARLYSYVHRPNRFMVHCTVCATQTPEYRLLDKALHQWNCRPETGVVEVRYEVQPIPLRTGDWSARRASDDETGPTGWGSTLAAAYENLLQEVRNS